MFDKVAVGTRFWGQRPEQIQAIRDFATRARLISNDIGIFVAVNSDEDKAGTLNDSELLDTEAKVFPVTPWGKFVMPLNALVMRATLAGYEHLLLASTEIDLSADIVSQLMSHMNQNVLVVGAAMNGHKFEPGWHNGTGRTTPWNTLSLWNLEYLSRTGFPLISDALFDGQKSAGVEEVSAIAMLQKLYSYPLPAAKLVEVSGVEWRTDHFDPERLAKHEAKMANKNERPARQLGVLNIKLPIVLHIPARFNAKY